MPTDKPYWIALHRIPGIGRVRFALLQRHFGTLDLAWKAPAAELAAAGLDTRAVKAIETGRAEISPEQELKRLAHYKVEALTLPEAAYPAQLREIYDAPPVLYYRGTFLGAEEWSVTVVGTRRVTPYGREVAKRLCTDFAQNKVAVVSGMARGIDAVAHEAALEAGGRTFAVQACGLDLVYPASHAELAKRIAAHGAVVSDYPLGTKPKPEYFPRRNRILAGLTMGTLVIEAPERSGALITASFAAEEGRDVFAVPGSILSPASVGTNRLIKDGARPILEFEDVMEELNFRITRAARPTTPTAPAQPQLALQPAVPAVAKDSPEWKLLRLLGSEPAHVDELCRLAALPIAEVSGLFAMLELKGLVKQVGAMTYVRAAEAGVEESAFSVAAS